MNFTKNYNDFYEKLVNINYYYTQIYNTKFVFEEDIKFDKLSFIDDDNMLSYSGVDTFKRDLISVNNKIKLLPSTIFGVSDFKNTMTHIHTVLEWAVESLTEYIDEITQYGQPIDDVSRYVKMNKKDEKRYKLIKFFRRLKSFTNTLSAIVNRLNKFKISDIVEFSEKVKSFEIEDYVKNDMILYTKFKEVIKNAPHVIENDYSSANEFLKYFKCFLIDLESDINYKKQTLEYYSERKEKTVEFCKIIKGELFEITYEYDYMIKNVLNKEDIEELRSQFTYLNSSDKK